VIELIAAVIGASVGVVASGIGSAMKRDRSDAVVVVRLTAAVEHIAEQVSLMREEIKADRQELFPRINQIEQRITRLEASK
jgi:outer membrane murein-binding lipoprotein Lpp